MALFAPFMLNLITRLFPLWALLFSGMAVWQPQWFAGQQALIVPLLIIIMFGMGLTLRFDDVRRVLRQPSLVLLGVGLQYLWMPLLAWLVSTALALSPALTTGMVLVGSVAGGTASNVICYLANGDVALSIAMTLLSTLLAVLVTPLLTWLYVGQTVPVPVVAMLFSILKIVLLPVLAGLLLNQWAGQTLQRLQPLFPLISVLAIVYVIAVIVALNASRLPEVGGLLILAIAMHNGLGLLSGYWSARWLGCDQRQCRTIAIEVGMQNSGLAVALATAHFASPLTALPGALFSIWHNLSGSMLAAWWRRSEPVGKR